VPEAAARDSLHDLEACQATARPSVLFATIPAAYEEAEGVEEPAWYLVLRRGWRATIRRTRGHL